MEEAMEVEETIGQSEPSPCKLLLTHVSRVKLTVTTSADTNLSVPKIRKDVCELLSLEDEPLVTLLDGESAGASRVFQLDFANRKHADRLISTIDNNPCFKLATCGATVKVKATSLNHLQEVPVQKDYDGYFSSLPDSLVYTVQLFLSNFRLLNEHEPGMRADTIILKKLPVACFSDLIAAKPNLRKVTNWLAEYFPGIDKVYVPVLSPLAKLGPRYLQISGNENCGDGYFMLYMSFYEYVDFHKAMQVLRNSQFIMHRGAQSTTVVSVKVEFDKCQFMTRPRRERRKKLARMIQNKGTEVTVRHVQNDRKSRTRDQPQKPITPPLDPVDSNNAQPVGAKVDEAMDCSDASAKDGGSRKDKNSSSDDFINDLPSGMEMTGEVSESVLQLCESASSTVQQSATSELQQAEQGEDDVFSKGGSISRATSMGSLTVVSDSGLSDASESPGPKRRAKDPERKPVTPVRAHRSPPRRRHPSYERDRQAPARRRRSPVIRRRSPVIRRRSPIRRTSPLRRKQSDASSPLRAPGTTPSPLRDARSRDRKVVYVDLESEMEFARGDVVSPPPPFRHEWNPARLRRPLPSTDGRMDPTRTLTGQGEVLYLGPSFSIVRSGEGRNVFFENREAIYPSAQAIAEGDWVAFDSVYWPKLNLKKFDCPEWEATCIRLLDHSNGDRRIQKWCRSKDYHTGDKLPSTIEGFARVYYVGSKCSLMRDRATGQHIFFYNSICPGVSVQDVLEFTAGRKKTARYIERHRLWVEFDALTAKVAMEYRSPSPPAIRSVVSQVKVDGHWPSSSRRDHRAHRRSDRSPRSDSQRRKHRTRHSPRRPKAKDIIVMVDSCTSGGSETNPRADRRSRSRSRDGSRRRSDARRDRRSRSHERARRHSLARRERGRRSRSPVRRRRSRSPVARRRRSPSLLTGLEAEVPTSVARLYMQDMSVEARKERAHEAIDLMKVRKKY